MNKLNISFNQFFLRVSLQEKVIFARHLAIMVKAGMPLLDALRMLQKQTQSKSLAIILEKVVGDISNGQFLATSLEKYKNVFGNLFVNIIRVGESSGILSENLVYLSEELKKKKELQKQVLGAMIYPIIILFATTILVTMLTVFIFPKILPVFSSLNVALPLSTRILIATSNFLIADGLLLLGGIAIALIVFFVLLRIRTPRFVFHWCIVHTPLVRKMSVNVNMTNITRTLGLLLRSGVKIVEAINITSDTLSSLVYQRELETMALQVQKGEQLAKYLATRPTYFPMMLTNMIAVGENTGNLSETLLYLSDFYESEVGETTKNLSSTLEPLLILVMGLIVGFVAVSIITPIYGLTQSVNKV